MEVSDSSRANAKRLASQNSTDWNDAAAALAFDAAVLAGVGAALAAMGPLTAAAAAAAFAAAAAAGAASAAAWAAGNRAGALASDPPRSDFETVATPLPRLPSTAGSPWKAFAITTGVLGRSLQALVITLERYDGARAHHDSASAERQLGALRGHAQACADLADRVVGLQSAVDDARRHDIEGARAALELAKLDVPQVSQEQLRAARDTGGENLRKLLTDAGHGDTAGASAWLVPTPSGDLDLPRLGASPLTPESVVFRDPFGETLGQLSHALRKLVRD